MSALSNDEQRPRGQEAAAARRLARTAAFHAGSSAGAPLAARRTFPASATG